MLAFISLGLAMVAIGLSFVAVFSYQWIALVPALGVRTLYRLRPIRIGIAVVALSSAALSYLVHPGLTQGLLVVVVIILTPLSGFLHAGRVFVPLDEPLHQPATAISTNHAVTVLGADIDGQGHAWSTDLLIPHHIINDVVNGRPILAAWCAYCHSGIVYDASVDGQHLTFEPVTIQRRNMVMRDRETGTLWQHTTGEALAGPLIGTTLTSLGGQLMTIDAWLADHPDSTLVIENGIDTPRGLLPPQVTRMIADRAIRITMPGIVPKDDRVGFTAPVIGIDIDDVTKAYPLSTIRRESPIEDTVDGVRIRITYDSSADRVRITSNEKPVPFQRTRWMGWFEFHPATAVYE